MKVTHANIKLLSYGRYKISVDVSIDGTTIENINFQTTDTESIDNYRDLVRDGLMQEAFDFIGEQFKFSIEAKLEALTLND